MVTAERTATGFKEKLESLEKLFDLETGELGENLKEAIVAKDMMEKEKREMENNGAREDERQV
jgi:hypothetical protein